MPPTLLCIDDDTLIRELLIVQLLTLTKGETPIYEAADGATGIRLAGEHHPDIVLLELGLPDMSGFRVIEEINKLKPRPRILILTASAPDQALERVQRCEVAGLLIKSDCGSAELLSAVRHVYDGLKYFSRSVREAMAAARSSPSHYTKLLSPREMDLLPFFGYGWTNERMATRTGLSIATIRTHRQNILRKLDLHSTEKLIHWAIVKGFTDYRYEPKDTAGPLLQEPSADWETRG